MIPNKKILNPKNNSPWLLCPSKSFPGKFYYFNGCTGEAAWCLSETDHNIRRGTINRITDKTHSYPEPFGPPIDERTNTNNSFTSIKNPSYPYFNNVLKDINPHYQLPAPTFGQAVFPKYFSSDNGIPTFMWALTPMLVPNQLTLSQSEMSDHITHHNSDQPMHIQTSTIPLNNRFQTIKRTLNFPPDSQSQKYSTPPFKRTFSQTAEFNPFSSKVQTFGAKMKDEACQTFLPKAKSLLSPSKYDSNSKSALKSRSVENIPSLFSKDIETASLGPLHKDDIKADKLNELDKNDLRLFLVAKKRKVASEDAQKSDPSKLSTQEPLTPKKRVTFDLQQGTSCSEDTPDVDRCADSSENKDLCQSVISEGPWYVVADCGVLISDLQSIEELVQRDEHCRLLVPFAVRTELETLSRGESGVVSARQLLRKLAAPTGHIVAQNKPDMELETPEDSILQCCWDLLQDKHRVILITNSTRMTNKAKSIDLECHSLDEILMMKDLEPAQEQLNQFKKLKIVVPNDKKKSENLFLQDLTKINGFSLNKSNKIPVKESRINNVFNPELKNNNMFTKNHDNTDKLINLTKPKNNLHRFMNSEIANVKDQMLKLRIADNSATRNRAKSIVKNVLTGVDNEIDRNERKTEIDSEIHRNDNITDVEEKNCRYRNITQGNMFDSPNNTDNMENIIEIDRDIRNLNVTENKPVTNDIKVSGVTKLNTRLNLDEELKRFCVKNGVMENRIKSRLDEWICRLNQTVEYALTDVLLQEKAKVKKMMPPWSLFEVIQLIGETYKKHHSIKTIVDRFSTIHLNCTSGNGKYTKFVKPDDIIKLIGLSAILIQNLLEIVNYKELYEADDLLRDLIRNIEDPNTDIDMSLEKFNTPILSRSDTDAKTPVGFRKNRAEIIEYLKKHFEAWKSYDIENPKDKNVDNTETTTVVDKVPNIVRTSGKNLNMLKINSTKSITMTDNTEKINEPKVIKHVKIIDGFEEKCKRKELDLNKLDYEDSLHSIPSDLSVTCREEAKNDDNGKLDSETNLEENEIVLLSDSESSDVNTECVQAYPLVKVFLAKLKTTFLQTYHFINECMPELQKGMAIDKTMLLKTEMAHAYLLKIAERLKSILARESGDGKTLKNLLIKAGDYDEDELIIIKYKQIITKYHEQAQILEEALKIMLSLSVMRPKDRDRYHGTFKTSSPILPTSVLRNNNMVHLTNEGFNFAFLPCIYKVVAQKRLSVRHKLENYYCM